MTSHTLCVISQAGDQLWVESSWEGSQLLARQGDLIVTTFNGALLQIL